MDVDSPTTPVTASPFPSHGPSRSIAILGAGPAGLMAAETLATHLPPRQGWQIDVFDRMLTPARKLLIAGHGGLNLTHTLPHEPFMDRYGDARAVLEPAIRAFPPAQLRAWAEGLGQPTFVGTSGRVFPTAFKAAPLLRAWLQRLDQLGVHLHMRHRWSGGALPHDVRFDTPSGPTQVTAEACLLALGGASWPRLGSDGAWCALLRAEGCAVTPLQASNCGVRVTWSPVMRQRFEGQPLKRIAVRCGDTSVRGEALITATGLEGGAIYALSAALRAQIRSLGHAELSVDLRPDLSVDELARRLKTPRGSHSTSNWLRRQIGLPPVAIGLLHEAGLSPHDPARAYHRLAPHKLAHHIKNLPLKIESMMGLDRAISSCGGVALDAIDTGFMLHRHPGVFVAGEMLDWDAPTGGYLLQASFSTGRAAAMGLLRWLGIEAP